MDEAVALRVQLGDLHEKQLHDVEAAIENYSAALERQPAPTRGARRARALPQRSRCARRMAAEVLEPIYVAQQRWPDLVRVYDVKLESATRARTSACA